MEAVLWPVFICTGLLLLGLGLQWLDCRQPATAPEADAGVGGDAEQAHAFAEETMYDKVREERKKRLAAWLDAKLGGSPPDSLNRDLLRAQREWPPLRRLVHEEVPRLVRSCVRTHRLTALASDAERILDIAEEPECFDLRERVVDLTELARERMQAYESLINDPDLLNNLVVIRGVHKVCCHCPYLGYAVLDAPLVCPSARALGIKPEGMRHPDGKH